VTHLALTAVSPAVAGLFLSALGAGLLFAQGGGRPVIQGQRLVFWALVLAGGLVASFPTAERLLLLPPVAISGALLVLFGTSLRPNQVPLVTRIARYLRGYPDPTLDSYTRRVTQVWVAFFAFLTVETTILALAAPSWLWAFFTGFLNYLLAGGLFLGEYLFRVRRHPQESHGGLGAFLASLVRMDWQQSLRNHSSDS